MVTASPLTHDRRGTGYAVVFPYSSRYNSFHFLRITETSTNQIYMKEPCAWSFVKHLDIEYLPCHQLQKSPMIIILWKAPTLVAHQTGLAKEILRQSNIACSLRSMASDGQVVADNPLRTLTPKIARRP